MHHGRHEYYWLENEVWRFSFQDGTCHFKKSTVGATDSGFVDIREGSETQLKKAVATVGPISVAIDASHESFQFYSDGTPLANCYNL